LTLTGETNVFFSSSFILIIVVVIGLLIEGRFSFEAATVPVRKDK